MDFALPAFLFVLGFTAALVASGTLKWSIRGRESRKLPLEDGAVRLDKIGSNPRRAARTDSEAAADRSEGGEAKDAGIIAAVPTRKGRREGARPRRRP